MNFTTEKRLTAVVGKVFNIYEYPINSINEWFQFKNGDVNIIVKKAIREKSSIDINLFSFKLNAVIEEHGKRTIILLFCDYEVKNEIKGRYIKTFLGNIPSDTTHIKVKIDKDKYTITNIFDTKDIESRNIDISEKYLRLHYPKYRAIDKYNSKLKDIEKNIFIDFYLEHHKNGCHYCGIKYQHIINEEFIKIYASRKSNRISFVFDEIDRIDAIKNNRYTLDNIVLCCSWCNNAKSNYFTYDDYKEFGFQGIQNIWKNFFKEKNGFPDFNTEKKINSIR